MKKLKKWTEVYPQGTAEGNEEQRFFISLARNKKYDWRSLAAIAKEANLTKKRTEEIMKKYHNHPTCPVFNNPKNEEQWAYWERVPEMCPKDTPSLSTKDQQKRIDKITPSASQVQDDMTTFGGLPPGTYQVSSAGVTQVDQPFTRDDVIAIAKELGSSLVLDDRIYSPAEVAAMNQPLTDLSDPDLVMSERDPEMIVFTMQTTKVHPGLYDISDIKPVNLGVTAFGFQESQKTTSHAYRTMAHFDVKS